MKKLIIFFCLFISNYLIAQNGNNRIMLIDNESYKISIGIDFSFEITNSDCDLEKNVIAYSNALSRVILNAEDMSEFFIIDTSKNVDETIFGKSTIINVISKDKRDLFLYKISFIIPDSLKDIIIIYPQIRNLSDTNISISKIIECNLETSITHQEENNDTEFWSFLPESTPERKNWIQPIRENFYQKNFQGMNAPDYGGGIPLLDIWSKNHGIALASLSVKPVLISFPLKVNNRIVNFSLEDSIGKVLKSQEEIFLQPYAIILHKGDFFNALQKYSNLLRLINFSFPESPETALEPEWCTWGYERDFSIDQILKTLDQIVPLGIKWVTIDDGWQLADGDWDLSIKKFNHEERIFLKLIDSIHSRGLKVRLWWVPLAASDSIYSYIHYPERMSEYGMSIQSKIALEHPDWFILDKEGKRVQVSWWNSYQLCPAIKEVREYYAAFVKKAIVKWNIDGFKIDGQNINLVPPCYNPSHNHSSPYESTESNLLFLKTIYETAKSLKPDFLIQLCPCGTNYSIYNLPFINQVVASDPLNSEQIRIKGKTFKALFGNRIAYSGDHVELTNRRWDDVINRFIVYKEEDFASIIGIGGVPSTKFTISSFKQPDTSLILTEIKKHIWKKWLDLYNNLKLSTGEYLNLYDIAFDKPETHLIRKRDTLYYSLFAKQYEGVFEFRGLECNKEYEIKNLMNGEILGLISCSNSKLHLKFNDYLILQGRPI